MVKKKGGSWWRMPYISKMQDILATDFFNITSLMRALCARTANHNNMHKIMCTAFMVQNFFLTAKIITMNNLFTY